MVFTNDSPQTSAPAASPGDDAPVRDALNHLWEQAEETFRARLDVCEDHVADGLLGRATEDGRASARNAAHKLAGTLGMFGVAAGSTLAKELEALLDTSPAPAAQLERMSEIVLELRKALDERSRDSLSQLDTNAGPIQNGPQIRVVGRDSAYLESVRWAGVSAGMTIDHVGELSSADVEAVDATIVDTTSVADAIETTERAARTGVPVLAIVGSDQLQTRSDIIRSGAATVVSSSTPPELVAQLAADLTPRPDAGLSVVAVGIDPAELPRMTNGFAAEGCVLTPVSDAGRLGEEIRRRAPDVVVVGEELADVNLIDALAVISADPVWSARWVVAVVAAERATELAPVALAAGADDILTIGRGWATIARRLRLRARRTAGANQSRFGTSSERNRLATRLATQLDHALEAGDLCSILYAHALDLRTINRTQGYDAGDQHLRAIEHFLRTFFRAGDVVGPWVGGGFVIGMQADHDVANRRLRAAVEDMARAGLNCRGAAASAPADGTDVGSLVSIAKRRIPPAGQGAPAAEPDRGGRIVVVEDDEIVGGLVQELLVAEGHEVQLIGDGPSAVTELTRPDVFDEVALVLLDITLPGVDGFGVLRAMQRANTLSHLPVVMLSARHLDEEIHTAISLGAVDHVAKPFSPQVLLRRVERALALVKT